MIKPTPQYITAEVVLTANAGYDVDTNSVWCEYEYQNGDRHKRLTVSQPLDDYVDYLSTQGIAEKLDGGNIVYLDDEGYPTHCNPYDWFSTCCSEENTAYAKSLPEWEAFRGMCGNVVQLELAAQMEAA